MVKRAYDWVNDPFDPKRQEEDEQEINRVKKGGFVGALFLTFLLIVFLFIPLSICVVFFLSR